VAGDRIQRIWAELSAGGDGAPSSARLCEASADIIGATGGGIMLMSGDVDQGSLCTTDAVSTLIEELQYGLGEGPCVEAYHTDRVVLEPNLADPATPRWPAFTPPAIGAGARAVFAFPLRLGAVRLGALNLYRDRPAPLSDEQHADGLVMADLITQWVLDMQAGAPAGTVAEKVELSADFHYGLHNAAGMVSVQLGVSVTEALVRLRAYAFGHDRPLGVVADDVIARKLRID
jgi:GAF domain